MMWEEILVYLSEESSDEQQKKLLQGPDLSFSCFGLEMETVPSESCPPDWAVFLGLTTSVFLRVQNEITRKKQKENNLFSKENDFLTRFDPFLYFLCEWKDIADLLVICTRISKYWTIV